jgi:Na+/alanine symporter
MELSAEPQFGTLTTALAATIGTSNIVGVATAVLWIWPTP